MKFDQLYDLRPRCGFKVTMKSLNQAKCKISGQPQVGTSAQKCERHILWDIKFFLNILLQMEAFGEQSLVKESQAAGDQCLLACVLRKVREVSGPSSDVFTKIVKNWL